MTPSTTSSPRAVLEVAASTTSKCPCDDRLPASAWQRSPGVAVAGGAVGRMDAVRVGAVRAAGVAVPGLGVGGSGVGDAGERVLLGRVVTLGSAGDVGQGGLVGSGSGEPGAWPP